jgi:pimeloyl-ACP methyl ester carboxylesterase
MRTVTVLGVRAGALIASRLAAERSDVDRIVLWDPIVDPAAYLGEAVRRSREAGTVIPEGWPVGDNDVTVELDGFSFTQAMGRSTLNNAIDVGSWRSLQSGLVVASALPPDFYAPLLKRAAEHSLTLTILNCPWPTGLDGRNVLTAGAIPLKAVEAIVAGLQ